MHGLDFDNSLEAGAMYALYRHGQDAQARDIAALLQAQQPQAPAVEDDPYEYEPEPDTPQPQVFDIRVRLDDDEDHTIAPVNALDFATTDMPDSWDDYIGQEPLKRRLMISIKSAQARGTALPHCLFASGYPGIGKTAISRLIAKTMGVDMIELVPPFNIYTLVAAAESLLDHDILFIDEIHRLAIHNKYGAEILLKILEDKVAFMPDGTVVELNDITIIGATTDPDMLPETVIDRFKIKPYFQSYSITELAKIAITFAFKHDTEHLINSSLAVDIAGACRGTPRIAEEFILAMRDLGFGLGRAPTFEELLDYMEVEADGLTRTHIHYLTAMLQYGARTNKDGDVEYMAGEVTLMNILRETKQGIGRIERFLTEQGMLDKTPRGRRLTDAGIERAEQFVREGKGTRDV